MPPTIIIRAAIGAVWLYEGLWCKVLGRVPHQAGIVRSVPGLTGGRSASFLVILGYAECALGLWALSGYWPWLCALVQTIALVSMNFVGILYARHLINDPPGMVIKNIVLLVLAWVSAGLPAS